MASHESIQTYDWIDEVIADVVNSGTVETVLPLRKLFIKPKFRDGTRTIQEDFIKYFMMTLQKILSKDLPMTDWRIRKIGELAHQISKNEMINKADSLTDSELRSLLLNEMNSEEAVIQDLLACGLFEDANTFALDYGALESTLVSYQMKMEEAAQNDSDSHWRMALFNHRNGLLQAKLDAMDEGQSMDTNLTFKDKIQDYHEYLEKEETTGLVIVNQKCEKKFENGNFYLNDLQAGLKFCKHGGKVKLKNGVYFSASHLDVTCSRKQNGPPPVIEVIGDSVNDCCVMGSLQISAFDSSVVIFRNIKFEVGDSAESNASINIFRGKVIFENCIFESFVNTAIYIHGAPVVKDDSSGETYYKTIPTDVVMMDCFFEGLQSCQRTFSIEKGGKINLSVKRCQFNEMYSVVSWFQADMCEDPEYVAQQSVSIRMEDSHFNDIQDGLRIVCLPLRSLEVSLERCSFNLVLYSESQSSAVDVNNASKVKIQNCLVKLNHTQGSAIKLSNISLATIEQNILQTDPQLAKRLSTSVFVNLSKVCKADIIRNWCQGLRIGMKFSDCGDVNVCNCDLLNSSVGVYVAKNSFTSSLRLEKVNMQSAFNGVLLEGTVSGTISSCTFCDVLIPVMTSSTDNLKVSDNQKKFSSDLMKHLYSDAKVKQVDLQDDKETLQHVIRRERGRDQGGDVQSAPGDIAKQLNLQVESLSMNNTMEIEDEDTDLSTANEALVAPNDDLNSVISDEDLKLYLIVEQDLPYQVSVDRKSTKIVPI